ILRAGNRLAPCFTLYEFAGPHELPALGWLGPLKLEVLRCLIDLILDRTLADRGEELVALLQSMAGDIISPVDLLEFGDALVAGVVVGLPLVEARVKACGRML